MSWCLAELRRAQHTCGRSDNEAAMDYGRLLGDALELTRRYRFLWVLGLFAGTSTCSPSFNFNTSLPSGTGFPRGEPGGPDFGFGLEAQRFMEQAGAWILAHLGLLI